MKQLWKKNNRWMTKEQVLKYNKKQKVEKKEDKGDKKEDKQEIKKEDKETKKITK